MAIVITDDCINCGACAVECPTEAIFESGESWKANGKEFVALSMEHFFVVTQFCDECSKINEIKCMAVCPMDAVKRS